MASAAPQIFILPEAFADQVFSIWWDQMPKKSGIYFYLASDWETNFISAFETQNLDLPIRVNDELLPSLENQSRDCYALIPAEKAEATGMRSIAKWRECSFFDHYRLLIILSGAAEPISGEGMGLPFVNSFIKSLFETHQNWSPYVSTKSRI